MNREELLTRHAEWCQKARDLMTKKNQDYAEDTSVFGNLEMCEHAKLIPTETGIVVRLFDKMSRLSTSCKRELAVKDESVEDTCLDIINYCVLLLAKRKTRCNPSASQPTEQKPKPPSITPSNEGTEWTRRLEQYFNLKKTDNVDRIARSMSMDGGNAASLSDQKG